MSEDNIIAQLAKQNYSLVAVGVSLWAQLYGRRHYSMVRDGSAYSRDTPDQIVSDSFFELMTNRSWHLLISMSKRTW